MQILRTLEEPTNSCTPVQFRAQFSCTFFEATYVSSSLRVIDGRVQHVMSSKNSCCDVHQEVLLFSLGGAVNVTLWEMPMNFPGILIDGVLTVVSRLALSNLVGNITLTIRHRTGSRDSEDQKS